MGIAGKQKSRSEPGKQIHQCKQNKKMYRTEVRNRGREKTTAAREVTKKKRKMTNRILKVARTITQPIP